MQYRSLLSVSLSAVVLALSTSNASAEALSVDFESFNLGQLPGGADARIAGNATIWHVPDNAATFGEVRAGVGLGGTQGLVVGNRGNGFDGVIDNIKSGKLAQAAGEAAIGAPNSIFTTSYFFRTAAVTATANMRFRSESWGPDRTTFMAFNSDGDGALTAFARGLEDDPVISFPISPVASGLQWGEWYRVVTEIMFLDGADNDTVSHYLYASDGTTLIGSAVGLPSWEEGARQAGFNGGNVFAVDAIGFHARGSFTGDAVFVDDVSWSSRNAIAAIPEPGSLALVLLAGLGAAAAARRRRA